MKVLKLLSRKLTVVNFKPDNGAPMQSPVDMAPQPEYRSSSVAVSICASGDTTRSATGFSLEESTLSQEISDVISLPVGSTFSTKDYVINKHEENIMVYNIYEFLL
jgi:hypothetical protein